MLFSRSLGTWGALFVAAGVLAGCAQVNKAPVEDRGGKRTSSSSSSSQPAVDPATLPGAENAGKPGYYTVKPGDTLIRIGLEHGQSWKDIARWSQLENPNVIEVGQVVRVVPPNTSMASTATSGSESSGGRTVAPVVVGGDAGESAGANSTATAEAPKASSTAASSNLGFIWPASGSVLAGFDEARNKGVDIGGKAGDAVVAAADGRVVYAGAGLRGYGNLIILKHNDTYLTAYAHNQKLLVKEDQNVKKGQKIAEMGSSDADRVKLHFEVRRQGKPVDPVRYLPAR